MTVVDGALDRGDLDQLARLHVDALPDSLVSLIGPRYARWFYRYVARSPHELVLLERDAEGAIAGACVVSLHPESFDRRMLVHTPLASFAALAIRRLPVRALIGGDRASGVVEPPGPELSLIFTAAGARSRGTGKRLLARASDALVARGIDHLGVKTVDDPANRAIAFYEREGFARTGAVARHGKRLLRLEASLPITTTRAAPA